jgi:holo-[acyl-carrier protein] synthase
LCGTVSFFACIFWFVGMIIGIGIDLCKASRWQSLLDRYGHKAVRRILSAEEANLLLSSQAGSLAEKAAGRWALREAVGKAMGTGLNGWDLRDFRYEKGKAVAVGELKKKMDGLGVDSVHATLSHDCGISVAIVVLESRKSDLIHFSLASNRTLKQVKQ